MSDSRPDPVTIDRAIYARLMASAVDRRREARAVAARHAAMGELMAEIVTVATEAYRVARAMLDQLPRTMYPYV